MDEEVEEEDEEKGREEEVGSNDGLYLTYTVPYSCSSHQSPLYHSNQEGNTQEDPDNIQRG